MFKKFVDLELSRNQQTIINITAAVLNMLVTTLISFVLSPYIVSTLGVEANGFVGLAQNFITYAALISTALNSMGSRFMMMAYYNDEHDKFRRYYSSLLFADLLLAVTFGILGGLCVWKLEVLLDTYPVTVVHPVVRRKYLTWIDPDTGEATPARRSPRVGSFADGGKQLIYILPLLGHPNLTVRLVLMDAEEQRIADGWGNGGKRGSHRAVLLPISVEDTLDLRCPADYAALIPTALPDKFTAQQFGKAAKMQGRHLNGTLKVLLDRGVLKRETKEGNAWVYARV